MVSTLGERTHLLILMRQVSLGFDPPYLFLHAKHTEPANAATHEF